MCHVQGGIENPIFLKQTFFVCFFVFYKFFIDKKLGKIGNNTIFAIIHNDMMF